MHVFSVRHKFETKGPEEVNGLENFIPFLATELNQVSLTMQQKKKKV